MISSIQTAVLISLAFASSTLAQLSDPQLVGTWTTKSKKVFTGPDFYNPVEDRLIEPELAGISYSFTADGFYETAYYRAVANPTTPQCPSAVMQWQHGSYTLATNGSIIMTPIAVDGRQLTSAHCAYDKSVYVRYNQAELMQRYEIRTDAFHNVPRLNLFQFDGSPMQPLYLYYTSPQMLPTVTLNPTAVASATGKASKRDLDGLAGQQQFIEPLNKNALVQPAEPFNADKIWWAGVGLTALGTVMYIATSS